MELGDPQVFTWNDDRCVVSFGDNDVEFTVDCDGADAVSRPDAVSPNDIVAWLVNGGEDELAAQYARNLRRDYPGERRVSWARMFLN